MTVFSTKIREPNILAACSNWQKLVRNTSYVLDTAAVEALKAEAHRNVASLFALGEEHLSFARTIAVKHWRQRVSRFYYAAYNVKRALAMAHSGDFSTDASDHKKISELPGDFPDANTFSTQLGNLRDDRNIADYSHLSVETDLVISSKDVEGIVVEFANLSRKYLAQKGITV